MVRVESFFLHLDVPFGTVSQTLTHTPNRHLKSKRGGGGVTIVSFPHYGKNMRHIYTIVMIQETRNKKN